MVIKVANFQNGQLLPYLLGLRPKSGSLKQRPCRLLSPDGLAQQVQGLLRTCHTAVLHQSTILAFFQLTNTKLLRSFKPLVLQKQTGFSFVEGPFSPCVYCMPAGGVSSSPVNVFFNFSFCMWCLTFFCCYICVSEFSCLLIL